MNDIEAAQSVCKKMLDDGADVENVVQVLRDRGFSKIYSIKALADSGKMDLGEAKSAVHESEAWSDVFDRDNALLEQSVLLTELAVGDGCITGLVSHSGGLEVRFENRREDAWLLFFEDVVAFEASGYDNEDISDISVEAGGEYKAGVLNETSDEEGVAPLEYSFISTRTERAVLRVLARDLAVEEIIKRPEVKLEIASGVEPDVAYLRLPNHPGRDTQGSVAKQVPLSSLLETGPECGTELYFDFDKEDRLIGVEILL